MRRVCMSTLVHFEQEKRLHHALADSASSIFQALYTGAPGGWRRRGRQDGRHGGHGRGLHSSTSQLNMTRFVTGTNQHPH
jgi:hypothetical protein